MPQPLPENVVRIDDNARACLHAIINRVRQRDPDQLARWAYRVALAMEEAREDMNIDGQG